MVALTGTWLAHRGVAIAPSSNAHRIATVYAPMIAVQWALFAYVIAPSFSSCSALLGERWTSMQRALVDIAVAAILISIIEIAAFALASRHASVSSILPHTFLERLVWVAVAVSAGFCEEVVYRGYLQRELGVIAQAVLFGIAHADRGISIALQLAFFGLLFGIAARSRKSLVAGIIAHVAIDLAQAFG